jgi:uncharacterized protein YkwD
MKSFMICADPPFMEGNMFCSKCGKEVSSEEHFCLRCGSNEKRQTPLNDNIHGTPLIHIDGNGWYYLVENRLRGPFSESTLRKKFIDGFLNEKVFVRFGTEGNWFLAADVPEFKNLVKFPNVLKRSSLRQFGKYLLVFVAVCLCLYLAIATIHKKQAITVTNNNELASVPQSQPKIATNKNEAAFPPPLQWGLTKSGVIAQTNKARQENGALPSLSENVLLNAIAEERLKDMFKNQYFSHYPPSGENFTELAIRFGYKYNRLAENIASGEYRNDEKVVDGWMQSPGHRTNILSSEVSEIGVAVGKGYLKGNETWIGVQIFGRPPDHH